MENTFTCEEGEKVSDNTYQNIDKTINCICDWIQQEIQPDTLFKNKNKKEAIEMTNALAALISARADTF